MKFKKIAGLFFAIIILLNINTAFASSVIYETETEEIISRGVILSKITQFTYKGWQSINMIKADLNDPYIHPNVITYGGGLSGGTTVKNFVSAINGIGGINADFFNPNGKGGMSPIGTVVNMGNLVSSPSTEDQMWTLHIDYDKTVFMDYVTADITIEAENGFVHRIGHINKYSSLTSPVVYTRVWGEKSLGAKNGIIEIVVEDGIITQMLDGAPPVNIPENGYVISFLKDYDGVILEHLTEGDKLKLNTDLSVDINNVYKAVGGGTMLVKDGQKAPVTHNISGVHPRTVAGTDESGKILYLIAVDGRRSSARGMSLDELSEFLISKGVHNAINFDGGGSTTLVARHEAKSVLEVINSPSDGSQRTVTNALGISSTAPEGDLSGLLITTLDSSIFNGTSRILNVLGYDEYHNPKNIDANDISWSVTGADGYFKDNKFYPTSAGDGVITAKIGNASGEYKIKVFDKPYSLELNSSKYVLGGKTQGASLYGRSADGYRCPINLADVKWSVSSNAASVSSGAINPKEAGVGILTVEFDGVKTFALIDNADGKGSKKLPESVAIKDPRNYVPDTAEGTVAVFTNTIKKNTMLDRYIMNKLNNSLNTQAEYNVFISGAEEATLAGMKGKTISVLNDTEFSKLGIDIINIDNTGGTMKNLSGQWENFLTKCDLVSGDSAVIFMTDSLNNFTDKSELALFKDILTEKLAKKGKTVFVFHTGGTDVFFDKLNGVRYIGLTNTIQSMQGSDVLKYADSMNYVLLFRDSSGNLNYEIKNLFE